MKMRVFILACLIALVPLSSFAETGEPQLRHMKVDLTNQASLLRGAHFFVRNCFSCHSAKYVRYQQLLPGLGISEKQLKEKLMPAGRKIGDRMHVGMTPAEGKKAFGNPPPDLSDIASIRGANWLYTYLTSFYNDPSRPSGVNNVVFPKVAMPDILWEQQGLQKPVYKTIKEDGKMHKVIVGVAPVTKGTMTPQQFDAQIRDLVNFLAYISAPYQQESHHIGVWVILLLIAFTISAYFLKKEYWKDVDH